MSGVIDELCSTVPAESNLSVGDRVVVYPTCEDEEAGDGSVQIPTIHSQDGVDWDDEDCC